jgi:hypothetical protein
MKLIFRLLDGRSFNFLVPRSSAAVSLRIPPSFPCVPMTVDNIRVLHLGKFPCSLIGCVQYCLKATMVCDGNRGRCSCSISVHQTNQPVVVQLGIFYLDQGFEQKMFSIDIYLQITVELAYKRIPRVVNMCLRQVSALTLSSACVISFPLMLPFRLYSVYWSGFCFLSAFLGPQKFPDKHRLQLNGFLFGEV